jgi:hypothetical protein
MGNAGLFAGVFVLAAGGGITYYLYTVYQKAVITNGGAYTNPTTTATGFLAWLIAGMPATWSSPPPPKSAVTVSLNPLAINGNSVSLNGRASTTTSGAAISMISIFWGDDTNAKGQFPFTHTYGATGTFNISVIATDTTGATGSATGSATIMVVTNQQITLTPSNVAYLSTGLITVKGTGFDAWSNTTISQTINGVRVWSHVVTTDILGNFTLSNVAPVYTTGGGTVIFTATDAGGRTATANLTITGIPLNLTLQVSTNNVASTGTITFSGNGYTPFTLMTLADNLNNVYLSYDVHQDGSFNSGPVVASRFTTVTQTLQFVGIDATGQTSPQVAVTITGTAIYSTNQSGYVLPYNEWNGAGSLGYNTNPVPMNDWNKPSSSGAPINFYAYGPGYYMITAPYETEQYFADYFDLLNWWIANGYS